MFVANTVTLYGLGGSLGQSTHRDITQVGLLVGDGALLS